MEKITERKLTDSKLNIWLKNLPYPHKKIFFYNLFSNRLIWSPDIDLPEKKKRFNNYRYIEVSQPNYPTKLLIYITALTVNPSLKIAELFDDIPQEWIKHLLPILIEASQKSNNFSYVENQAK